MNAEQKKIVRDMQSGELPRVYVATTGNARALIDAGYARAATIDPAPEDGQAINLTAKGRGYSEGTNDASTESPRQERATDKTSTRARSTAASPASGD